MKLVKNGTQLLLEFTSLEEGWYDFLVGAGGVVAKDIKDLIGKIKDLKADDQDRALKFLNKAFAAKQRGDKENYKKYMEMAVQVVRQEMALGIQQHPKKATPPPPPPEAYVDEVIDLSQLNEEIQMKVTQQQLKQIINEEIQKMAEEGNLEEGFLDFLKGAGGKAAGDAGGAVKRAGQAVAGAAQRAGQAVAGKAGEIKKAGQTASVKADIPKLINKATKELQKIGSELLNLQQRATDLGVTLELDEVESFIGQAVRAAEAQLQNMPK